MGAAGVRRGGRGPDQVDGRVVAPSSLRCRVVGDDEAQELAPALAALHREAMAAGMALGLVEPVEPTELVESYRELLTELGARERVLVVAESEAGVVGMAHLVPSGAANASHRAEVQRVAVAAAARGTGVGRRLMAAVEEEARRRGLTLLWLTTHAATAAEAFYDSVGYIRLGVMPNYSRRPDGTLWPGAFYYRDLGDERQK